jgi:hypothetical protein
MTITRIKLLPLTKLVFVLSIYWSSHVVFVLLLLPSNSYEEQLTADSLNTGTVKFEDGVPSVVDEEEDQHYEEEVDHDADAIRIAKYHELGYTWPIPDNMFVPNTTGFIRRMRERIEQIDKIEDVPDRWTGFSTIAVTGMIVPNFTEHGFGITKCIDEELMDKLRTAIREGYETAELEELDIIMPGPNPPVMVRDQELLTRVYEELHRYAEAWSGMKLLAYGAYGFRVYRDGAQLLMHIDIPETHVISFILHIDHSDDATPWPLVIEDYHGNTHEVTLESGDLLFYESAKLLHGRPRPLNGSWYSSVFVHYHPAEGWLGKDIDEEASWTVAPGWEEQLLIEHTLNVPRMQLFETGFTEPDCEHQWCGLQNSIKWGGPAEAGYWIAPNMERYPLDIRPYVPPPEEEAEALEL